MWKVATGAPHGIVRNKWRELSPLPFDMRVACDGNANVVSQHGQLISVLTEDGQAPALTPCAPAISTAASLEARSVMSDARYVVVRTGFEVASARASGLHRRGRGQSRRMASRPARRSQ